MDINVGSCLGTLLLILALSADLLTASMVYGAGHIGISFGLTILISGLGSAILGTALFIGRFLGDYFPGTLLVVGQRRHPDRTRHLQDRGFSHPPLAKGICEAPEKSNAFSGRSADYSEYIRRSAVCG